MEKVKVLIVDDSKVSRAMLEGNLAKTNFEVCAQAKNAAEAVELYEQTKPAVVTMDMNLPDADGIECSRRIRAIDPDAKIVMISAMKDASLVAKGREVGISAFLQKPVSVNELIDTLMILCQNKVGKVAVLRESYAKPFVRALQQGIFSMTGIHSEVELEEDSRAFLEVSGIAVIVGLTGLPNGRAIVYMDSDTMHKFSMIMLDKESVEDITEDEASESVEEAVNIIVGRGVSNINDVFKDKEMRITPPGTIVGSKIRIASPKLTTFRISAKTRVGEINMSVGFAEGE
ncbi:MAG: response regulator [Selenomonas sp.]|uniref:response regulator n=1 Tax=Selenomonas sp. AE3005 TaxID=1485543 RepID=UPI00048A07D7|nr:response regulator [Selenomonas sp. AE3005]MBQ1461241.1 response regulator [Selenomonas sp.]MBQ1614630.1 response regulator [Selenomonas sp.]MBQ1808690.1 response regulator [Selenomonas sp.]MBQ1919967.1 response regulator [Selenomonas sp.]MBQ4212728.1 response regulator [Selenomonas sp.]